MKSDSPAIAAPAAQGEAPHPSAEIKIATGLVLGFGGLVFLAVASVLALGIWSARTNTIDLLRDKSEAASQQIVSVIDQYLRPVENQLTHLARQIEAGTITFETGDLGKYFAGALSATPEVRSLVLIGADNSMLRALRHPNGVALDVIDVRAMPVISNAMDVARDRTGLYWAEIVLPETADQVLVNVRHPVRIGGNYVGLLAATVQVDQFSQILDDTARTLKGTAFILYDHHMVLAHPLLQTRRPPRGDNLLPTIAEVGDPVLLAFDRPQSLNVLDRDFTEKTGIRLAESGGTQYAMLSRVLNRYSDKPWEVGVYFAATDITDELTRLRWAAIAGIAVLLVSLLVAYGYSRYLTVPLIRLSIAARRVSDLSLDTVERLPRTLFVELNAAAQAFNAMVVGLRWFETYVPRKLVQRLVGHGEWDAAKGAMPSKERTVTVMFTDIAGFTTMAEKLPAPEVAALLNRHFGLVTACIEAEGGTVDKFIGDAVMAFWGAPEKQKDHAARGCRAALAIAEAMGREGGALGIRIGLHSGDVVVGNIGAPGRINYTIVGDTVNTANRLEQLGKSIDNAGNVVVVMSGVTRQASKLDLPVKSIGMVEVRGRQGQIEAFYVDFRS